MIIKILTVTYHYAVADTTKMASYNLKFKNNYKYKAHCYFNKILCLLIYLLFLKFRLPNFFFIIILQANKWLITRNCKQKSKKHVNTYLFCMLRSRISLAVLKGFPRDAWIPFHTSFYCVSEIQLLEKKML